MEASSAQPAFSLRQARTILHDLFRPNPWIYWSDFLGSILLGGLCFAMVLRAEPLSLTQLALFLGSCMLYYRASLFTHELVHLRAGTFRGFRVAWNLLCGIPFLMPSFTYYTHVDHHRRKHFGTRRDGEYLALATKPPREIFFYLAQVLVIPLLAVARWGVMVPLAWLSPRLRRWLYQHASSMVMDPSYIRPLPTREVLRVIRWQEIACFGYLAGVAVLLLRGRLPAAIVLQAYLTGVVILTLNALRTMGAHRFVNRGAEMTFIEQMLDSVNYPHRVWATGLWGPVGLRFHALHHLFPTLPYHNLPEAHRRLMARLPADSVYRLTEATSLITELRKLWRHSVAAGSGRMPSLPEAAALPAPRGRERAGREIQRLAS